MKVLQVIAGTEKGGAESFFSRLAIGFQKQGIQQHLITRDIPFWNELFARNEIPVTHSNFTPLASWFIQHKIRNIAKDFKPDIVLTWMNRASSMTPRGPYVKVARLGGYYNYKYYQNCDHLIGNTTDVVEYLNKGQWPTSMQIEYIQNYVDEPSSHIPAAQRAHYDTPEDVPLIFSLGRLHINKGFDILVSALHQIPQVYLWIAGTGSLEHELRQQVETLGMSNRVRFLGWQHNPTPFFKAADIFICPSRHEPFGNVVAEAWSHKIPVIATAAQGPSLLIKSGMNGILTPVDQIQPLAEAITALIQDQALKEKIAQGGYQSYQTELSETIVIKKYLDFFKRILG